MFASLQTIQSLRVSLLSMKDILALLFKKGVSYVLTVKLNQDPLEVNIFRLSCYFVKKKTSIMQVKKNLIVTVKFYF